MTHLCGSWVDSLPWSALIVNLTQSRTAWRQRLNEALSVCSMLSLPVGISKGLVIIQVIKVGGHAHCEWHHSPGIGSWTVY